MRHAMIFVVPASMAVAARRMLTPGYSSPKVLGVVVVSFGGVLVGRC